MLQSFCRFHKQELDLLFVLTNEMMLIQKQQIFERRRVVINLSIHSRMQYRYDFKVSSNFKIAKI